MQALCTSLGLCSDGRVLGAVMRGFVEAEPRGEREGSIKQGAGSDCSCALVWVNDDGISRGRGGAVSGRPRAIGLFVRIDRAVLFRGLWIKIMGDFP